MVLFIILLRGLSLGNFLSINLRNSLSRLVFRFLLKGGLNHVTFLFLFLFSLGISAGLLGDVVLVPFRSPLFVVTGVCSWFFPLLGQFMEARYITTIFFIDLKATVGTYELRSYGGEQ